MHPSLHPAGHRKAHPARRPSDHRLVRLRFEGPVNGVVGLDLGTLRVVSNDAGVPVAIIGDARLALCRDNIGFGQGMVDGKAYRWAEDPA